MSPHAATWNEISALLREARLCLPPEADALAPALESPVALASSLAQFEEFLEHNELELAWDTLAEIAENTHASPPCWLKLACAARLMQLFDKADKATRHAAGPANK